MECHSLDPDQAGQNVEPDLGPNCLQRLSADDTHSQRDHHYQFCYFATKLYFNYGYSKEPSH